MGISLKSLSEGCCEYLESLGCINLDEEKEDKTMSSVDKVALDYFDASINRISAWVVGFRNFQKALLFMKRLMKTI